MSEPGEIVHKEPYEGFEITVTHVEVPGEKHPRYDAKAVEKKDEENVLIDLGWASVPAALGAIRTRVWKEVDGRVDAKS